MARTCYPDVVTQNLVEGVGGGRDLEMLGLGTAWRQVVSMRKTHQFPMVLEAPFQHD